MTMWLKKWDWLICSSTLFPSCQHWLLCRPFLPWCSCFHLVLSTIEVVYSSLSRRKTRVRLLLMKVAHEGGPRLSCNDLLILFITTFFCICSRFSLTSQLGWNMLLACQNTEWYSILRGKLFLHELSSFKAHKFEPPLEYPGPACHVWI